MSKFDFITYVAQPLVIALMILVPIVLFYLARGGEE